MPNSNIGGGGAGTVTSVDVSGGSTGLTFSGGPVVDSGTISMAGALAAASGGSQVLKATPVTLTNAQIKALPSTGIQLIAAPGGSNIIIPILVAWDVDTTAAAYTNFTTDGIVAVGWGIGAAQPGVYGQVMDSVRLLGQGNHQKGWSTLNENQSEVWGTNGNVYESSLYTNKALGIGASNDIAGDFTGGNAANSLTLTVYYVLL